MEVLVWVAVKESQGKMNECQGALLSRIESNGYRPAGAMFNIYHVSPAQEKEKNSFGVTQSCFILAVDCQFITETV